MTLLTRRSFLAGAGAIGGSVLLPGPVGGALAADAQALAIPDLIDARLHGNSLVLRAESGEAEIFPDWWARTAGFNGPHLGPTLRLHRSDEVEITVSNALRESTAVHWHGLLAPSNVDGGPHQPIAPGADWRPQVRVDQPAATLWYHAHLHGRIGPQVYAGMAGMLIVTDDEEQRSLCRPLTGPM